MPTRATTDISHEQLTDHDIERHPHESTKRGSNRMLELVPVGSVNSGDRELGLAYAQMAEHGDQASGERALALLKQAEREGATDAAVHVCLGFLEQISGAPDAAQREYKAALAENAFESTALANLAVIDAAKGDAAEAVKLFERAVAADPGETAAGLDLALLQCKFGEKAKALQTIERAERFNPDNAALHEFSPYREVRRAGLQY